MDIAPIVSARNLFHFVHARGLCARRRTCPGDGSARRPVTRRTCLGTRSFLLFTGPVSGQGLPRGRPRYACQQHRSAAALPQNAVFWRRRAWAALPPLVRYSWLSLASRERSGPKRVLGTRQKRLAWKNVASDRGTRSQRKRAFSVSRRSARRSWSHTGDACQFPLRKAIGIRLSRGASRARQQTAPDSLDL